MSSHPPTAKRFPLRLAAVDHISGVSGRVFQTDVGLTDLRIGEVAFWMRIVRGAYWTVVILLPPVPPPPSRYQVSAIVTEVVLPQGTGRGSAVCH